MKESGATNNESVESYLTQRGAVELLCILSPIGSRFTELADEVDVSRTTLSQRLEEGQEVSLITTVESGNDQRTAHEYVLTEAGARLRMAINQSGLTTTYRLLKNYQRQFDEQSKTVREWVERNEDALWTDSDTLNAREYLAAFDDLSSND